MKVQMSKCHTAFFPSAGQILKVEKKKTTTTKFQIIKKIIKKLNFNQIKLNFNFINFFLHKTNKTGEVFLQFPTV